MTRSTILWGKLDAQGAFQRGLIGEPRLIKINGQRGDFMKTEKFVIQEKVGTWRDLYIFDSLHVARAFIAGSGSPEDLRIIRRVDEVIK